MQNLNQYLNKIIEGDCIEILKEFPSNSIDCVCSDVPYLIATGGATAGREDDLSGILNKNRLKQSGDLKSKWLRKDEEKDNITFLTSGKLFENVPKFEEWLSDVYRVLKDGSHCYLMINSRNLKELQQKAENVGFKLLNILIWIKNNATPNKYYMQKCEFILFLRKGFAKNIKDMGATNVLNVRNPIGNKFHPTEKPVELMLDILKQSVNSGDIVLDMFCGSGSTCIAAKGLGCSYIGIEIDKTFADIAKDRIKNPLKARVIREEQMNLFMEGKSC